ncbi:ABC transporter ATP-binding protein [Dactylosporangium matsuzakiense]|uniref:ABC transporter ATP-binding protein n=1 Tax=Dactylosporangium matsuzakiense TaxID=53360 RepID=A0A9W6NM75_9ACTN|nr:ABC transporter ATP-binding protein [Dactylosporangium matsuzakiense]UWZ43183.1 ABC transporter ATP-binding protein [Dactylosporangium matsuzakiense]GLL02725.1 ABC transporter ATP-binding protein [Dactylosporangium matsuzakiense]
MNAVELEKLSYRYGNVRAVEDVSLTVAAGEVVAMLGPNGAGKSTTLLMLLGLLPPATGTVRLFGSSPAAACAAGRVGAMPQAGGLLPRSTVGDLLRFLHDVYPDPMPIAEALATADLTDLVDRTVEKLSGGQGQRLRFAMALIGRPDLLVLDEPTAALDVEARQEFWAAIRRYARQGRTVLFSTHYLEEADANADRILVLDRGRVIADGTADSVKRRVSVRTVSVVLQNFDYSVLPGVAAFAQQGGRAVLTSTDSDATVLALAEAGLLRDLEVAGAGLEEAYLALTRVEA